MASEEQQTIEDNIRPKKSIGKRNTMKQDGVENVRYSKTLLSDSRQKQESSENTRPPLKTIADCNTMPGPSHGRSKMVRSGLNSPLKVDTKHVTLRRRNELDWDYEVFSDATSLRTLTKSNNIDTTNIHNDCVKKANMKDVKVNENRRESAGTPTLEHNAVKNIKKTLKRPHSKELQRLSPNASGEKINEKGKNLSKSYYSLQEKLQSPDQLSSIYTFCLTQDYTSDIFAHLLTAERKHPALPAIPAMTRACVLNWLTKVNNYFTAGNPEVIQTACWYLDSMLTLGRVSLSRLQLIASACYWIAEKLHGPPISATKLVKCAADAFTLKDLLDAEKAVLCKLKFPLQPVIPQDYTPYLSWWCDNNSPGEIEATSNFLCLAGQMVDKTLCNEYPSAIAAAAVKNALLLLDKKPLMIRLEMCPEYVAAEKKTSNMSIICAVLRKAIRILSSPKYEYKFLFDQYNLHPYCIAQKIARAANELAVMDERNIASQ